MIEDRIVHLVAEKGAGIKAGTTIADGCTGGVGAGPTTVDKIIAAAGFSVARHQTHSEKG